MGLIQKRKFKKKSNNARQKWGLLLYCTFNSELKVLKLKYHKYKSLLKK